MKQIRPIRPSDRAPVLSLLEGTGAFQPHEIQVAMELVDVALTKPEQGDYLPFVMDQDGAVLAYACFGKNPMTQFAFDLYWLATHREHMRQGHGLALVQFVEAEVRRRGGRLLVIETSSKGSYAGSRDFYVRLGCELAGVLPDFYDVGDDRVIYFKRL